MYVYQRHTLVILIEDARQKAEAIPFHKGPGLFCYGCDDTASFLSAALNPSYDSLCSKEEAVSGEPEWSDSGGGGGVIVLGALTAVGSWLTLTLVGGGVRVFPIAHSSEVTVDELVWYRRDQLLNAGIRVHVVDTTSMLSSLLETANISNVVYVPGLVESNEIDNLDNKLMNEDLNNFISILEVIKNIRLRSFVLLSRSPSSSAPLLATWSHSFEATLSVYHRLYHIPVVVVRTGDLYGPWTHLTLNSISQSSYQKGGLHQCWYIADVALVVRTALPIRTHCLVVSTEDCNNTVLRSDAQGLWGQLDALSLHNLEDSIFRSNLWGRAYVQRDAGKEVVMTSYFTTARDPQWNVSRPPNHFQYMLEWYQSLKQLGLEAVVFHDGLDAGFMHRVLRDYSKVTFVLVPSLQNRSTNDARFYAYQTYLDNHPDISMVLLTDISDVRFQKNPFSLMHLLGDNIYVGTDIDVFPSVKYMPWIGQKLEACLGHHAAPMYQSLQCLSELDTVYNAGVIGGTRHVMAAALWWITRYLSVSPAHLNCNMAAVNVALHRHFYGRIFTGFPLVSRFMCKQASPKGVYIIHK